MLSSPLLLHKNIWFTVLAACSILLGGLFLLHHVPVVKQDTVATALLTDIVFTFPVVYYFMLIRPLKLRKWSLFLVFTCCCGVAYLVLPAHQRQYIIQLRKLSFLVELGVILYALSQIKKITIRYRELQANLPDSAYNLHQSLTSVLGDRLPVKLLASELIMLRFGLLCWKRSRPLPAQAMAYTVYRQSGYGGLFGVLLSISLLELTGVHLLILKYSVTAAIVVSLFSLYGIIFLVSDFSAIMKNPILLMNNQLLLRVGMRWRTQTDVHNIASIQLVKDNYQAEGDCFSGSVMKSSVNVLLVFKQPVIIERLYRKPVVVNQILMNLDHPEQFIEALELSA